MHGVARLSELVRESCEAFGLTLRVMKEENLGHDAFLARSGTKASVDAARYGSPPGTTEYLAATKSPLRLISSDRSSRRRARSGAPPPNVTGAI